ncbi:MAG TPA: LuxR C-terminal-related transcriptional regulator [Actinoplanes sp.]|nr:LuxR C-terminal-related transcriptional regulator [Actinoplanes sp.]
MPATRSISAPPAAAVLAYAFPSTAPPRPAASDLVDDLVGSARDGRGGSLVLRDASGAGFAAPLERAVERAAGMRVVRLAGAEPEAALDFAALQRIVHPFLPRIGRVPGPQRDALGAALGLVAAAVPNLFLIGMAVLTLLADAAVQRPLLLIVEDAQWLDHATSGILAFVARRLTDHPIAMVIAVRETTTAGRASPDLVGVTPHGREPGIARAQLGTIGRGRPPARPGRRVRAAARTVPRLVALERGDAPSALLRAAGELRHREPERVRDTLLDAMYAGLMAGHLTSSNALIGIAAAARAWEPPAAARPTAADLLLEGFTARLVVGYPVAAPILRDAVQHLLHEEATRGTARSLLAMGCWAAGELLDTSAQQVFARRWERAKHTGTGPDPLPLVLSLPGPFPAGSAWPYRTENSVAGLGDVLGLAWAGREADARPAVAEHARIWTERGLGHGVLMARYAETILELGLGRYDAALTGALDIYRADPPGLGTQVLADLVEAASRCHQRESAAAAARRLAERALAGGSATGNGLLARADALIADRADVEAGFRASADRLTAADSPAETARTHLLFGEWLRRHRRRRDARDQLGRARDMFTAMGATAFARRASGELDATGERVGHRAGTPPDRLTPQEEKVARLVAEGASNRQVGEHLFISTNTVEYHLQKIFRKLGVSSRTQLVRALLERSDPT